MQYLLLLVKSIFTYFYLVESGSVLVCAGGGQDTSGSGVLQE